MKGRATLNSPRNAKAHASVVAFVLSTTLSLSAAATVGDRAPEIQFDKLLPQQPVSNASFKSLRGKVVVLEMWATWCGPCVAAIPHLNDLAEKFQDRAAFLSVSNEEPALVEKFLTDHPIRGTVGIAHTNNPSDLFGTKMVPQTVLIDTAGKIAGIMDPDMLTASMLGNFIAGRPIPEVQMMLEPSKNQCTGRNGWNLREMRCRTLRSMIALAWDLPSERVTGEPLSRGGSYDFSLFTPTGDPATFEARARDALAAAFELKIKREIRESDVWVLAKTEVRPAALKEPPSSVTAGGWVPTPRGGTLKLTNCTLQFMVQFFESMLGKPVVDETGITGNYDINLTLRKPAPEGAIEAIRNGGFKLEPARRPVAYAIVTGAQ